MKRVLIASSTFRLSRAGVDVEQASAADLIFDGFGYAYNGIYLSGFYPSTSMVNTGSTFQGVVNFGKTFSGPPQCVVRLFDVNHSDARCYNYQGYATDDSGQGVGPPRYAVTTNNLTVTIPYSGSLFPSKIGFSYAAMQI